MTVADSQYRVARSMAAALAAAGVDVVSVGAGSRSTPLTLAFADDGRFRVVSHVDERVAGFFALGVARATGRPAVVVTTSGTAVANLAPAVVEASMAGVPLVCLTADRPPELHDVGAVQTVPQAGSLSPVRWSADIHAYDEDGPSLGAHVAGQAAALALGPRSGPVHVNIRFREPLTPSPEERSEGSPGGGFRRISSPQSPGAAAIDEISHLIADKRRGMVYVGHLEGDAEGVGSAVAAFARAAGYPVVAEASSRIRGLTDPDLTVDAFEALIRDEMFMLAHRPQVIVHMGRSPLTRAVGDWMLVTRATRVVIDPSMPWPDADRRADVILAADPALALDALAAACKDVQRDDAWTKIWSDASRIARAAISEYLDTPGTPVFEGTIARALARALPPGGICYTSTSLPIRALDSFVPATDPLEVYANRGASGIDGTISGALGAAFATGRPTVCLTGDLAFIHDVGAMLTIARRRIPIAIVVVDNGGGGIFEFLPQAVGVDREKFEDLFLVNHQVDLMHAAELFSTGFAAARDADSLHRSLEWAFTARTPQVIRVPVNGQQSVAAHRTALDRATAAIGTGRASDD